MLEHHFIEDPGGHADAIIFVSKYAAGEEFGYGKAIGLVGKDVCVWNLEHGSYDGPMENGPKAIMPLADYLDRRDGVLLDLPVDPKVVVKFDELLEAWKAGVAG